jgi:hypothetical protein
VTASADVFQEVLAELSALMEPAAVERTFKWSAQYLAREKTLHQFSGAAGFGILTAVGKTFMSSREDRVPGALLIPTLSDFTRNPQMRFYAGRALQITAIAKDVRAAIGGFPEIVVVQIIDFDRDGASSPTISNLAFVGLENEPSELQPAAAGILADELLHPVWCHGRRRAV